MQNSDTLLRLGIGTVTDKSKCKPLSHKNICSLGNNPDLNIAIQPLFEQNEWTEKNWN